MIQKIFPLWFIIVMFAQPLFVAICSQIGLEQDPKVFKLYLGGMAFVSCFFYCQHLNKRYWNYDCKILFFLGLFGILYYYTSLLYEYSNALHLGHFLRWGVQCIPSTLMGIVISRYTNKELINYYIPIIVGILTPIIGSVSLSGDLDQAQFVDEESGLNYQVIAYYMALLFGSTAYYIFIAKEKYKIKIIDYFMYICLAIQGIVCARSGGRGGFILLCVLIIYILYIITLKKIFSKAKITKLLIGCSIIFMYLAEKLQLWESAGFQRAINPLEQQTGRKDDWELVLNYFYDSPVWGNGLGSNFYTWGFYSHNIIVDFLAETGIIGTFIFIYIFYKMNTKIYRQALKDNVYVFFMIFAFYGLIFNAFSGYWISTYPNWLILGIYWNSLYLRPNQTST